MIRLEHREPRRLRRAARPRGWALVRRTLADIGTGVAMLAVGVLACVVLFGLFYVFGAGPGWVRWTMVGAVALAGCALLGRGFRRE